MADPGYMLNRAGVPKGAIITALGGDPTPDLEAFAAALRRQPHHAKVPLEFFTFNERHRKKSAIMQAGVVFEGGAKRARVCVCVCVCMCVCVCV